MKVTGFYVARGGKVKDIDVNIDKVLINAGIAYIIINNMTGTAYAADTSLSDSLKPLINKLKDLAEPVSYGFMIKGFMQYMSGEEHAGIKSVKSAMGGYIGIRWIPYIYSVIKSVGP